MTTRQHPSEEPDDNPIRQAILAAMERLLAGAPHHVAPGQLTVVALAEEAGVNRNNLNGPHKDLRELFVRRRDTTGCPTPTEQRLLAERERLDRALDEASHRCRRFQEEATTWQETADTFARVIQTLKIEAVDREARLVRLERENARLRETGPPIGNVATLPVQMK